MYSVDPLDKWLDPPDEPQYSACDGCGEMFDTGDLTKTGEQWPYRWLCAECAEAQAEEQR